jgi:hypothetical protein
MISPQITDHRSQIQNLQVQIPDLDDSKSPCPTYYATQTHRMNYSKYSTAIKTNPLLKFSMYHSLSSACHNETSNSPGRIPWRHSSKVPQLR